MLVEILNKLSFHKGNNLVLVVAGSILAPFMFIFQFFPEIFEKNGLVSLLLISISIGLPITIIIFALTIVDQGTFDSTEADKLVETLFSQLGISCVIIGAIFYMPCLYKYFRPELAGKEAILIVSGVFFSYIVSSVISIRRGTTKKVSEELNRLSQQKQKETNDQ